LIVFRGGLIDLVRGAHLLFLAGSQRVTGLIEQGLALFEQDGLELVDFLLGQARAVFVRAGIGLFRCHFILPQQHDCALTMLISEVPRPIT